MADMALLPNSICSILYTGMSNPVKLSAKETAHAHLELKFELLCDGFDINKAISKIAL